MRRLQYADEARRELVALARYSRAEWGEAHARAFFDELEHMIEHLRDTPEIGQQVAGVRPGVRRRVHRTLSIYYTIETDAVRILAILHGRRDAASALADRA